MEAATTTRLALYGWSERWDPKYGNQRVFGHLVMLARPTMDHYVSDLYHDVHWIDRHVTGEMTFFFGADNWGTAIGTDEDLVRQARKNVWRCQIVREGTGHWWLEVSQVVAA